VFSLDTVFNNLMFPSSGKALVKSPPTSENETRLGSLIPTTSLGEVFVLKYSLGLTLISRLSTAEARSSSERVVVNDQEGSIDPVRATASGICIFGGKGKVTGGAGRAI
jgi:hypothetical protein